MKAAIVFLVLIFSIIACTDKYSYKQQSKARVSESEFILNKVVYDSIQVFVRANIQANLRSELYLLEFIDNKSDSMNYILTTLLKKSIPNKYRLCKYIYNIDSSILIINDSNALIDKNLMPKNQLSDIVGLHFSDDTGDVIFNPAIWKLSIIGNKVFVDRFYGQIEAEKKILPAKKFRP